MSIDLKKQGQCYTGLVVVHSMTNQRTLQQNKALWLFYQLLADELNAAGLDQRKVLKPSVAIPWSKDSIHDMLWLPIQEAMYGTDSTTQLTSEQIDKVYDVLNRHLGETTGVHVPFPSEETKGL